MCFSSLLTQEASGSKLIFEVVTIVHKDWVWKVSLWSIKGLNEARKKEGIASVALKGDTHGIRGLEKVTTPLHTWLSNVSRRDFSITLSWITFMHRFYPLWYNEAFKTIILSPWSTSWQKFNNPLLKSYGIWLYLFKSIQ